MKFLIPCIERRLLPRMLAVAAIGALAAGTYGIIHDQITYSISPEYFTRFKFEQFKGADFGFSPRVFVAEIGFLATWWVGLFAGWFFGRIAFPKWPLPVARRHIIAGFWIMIGFAVTGGLVGLVYSAVGNPSDAWLDWSRGIGAADARSVIRVGYIHWGSYLGALPGFLAGLLYLFRRKRAEVSSSMPVPVPPR